MCGVTHLHFQQDGEGCVWGDTDVVGCPQDGEQGWVAVWCPLVSHQCLGGLRMHVAAHKLLISHQRGLNGCVGFALARF